jgi:hypothetical protein
MKRSSGPRKTAILSESIHQQLNTYALAASAAGVSFIALAQPAQAKIVYTTAHVKIGSGGVGSYDLDLNHDGVTDFTLSTAASCDIVRCFYSFNVNGRARSSSIAFKGRGQGRDLAQALPRGAVIGVQRHFGSRGGMADATYFATGKEYVTGHWFDSHQPLSRPCLSRSRSNPLRMGAAEREGCQATLVGQCNFDRLRLRNDSKQVNHRRPDEGTGRCRG